MKGCLHPLWWITSNRKDSFTPVNLDLSTLNDLRIPFVEDQMTENSVLVKATEEVFLESFSAVVDPDISIIYEQMVAEISERYETITSEHHLSSPNNVTFGLKGMFYLVWKWERPNTSCQLNYTKEMRSLSNGNKRRVRNKSPDWELEIHRMLNFDLNGYLYLHVEAKCYNMTVDSLNRTVQLVPGDEGTSVKNFQCVWLYQEHVKCTWQPGPNTPANINYRVLYWIQDWNSISEDNRLYTSAEFWDLLETGRTVELYSTAKTFGCQFLLDKSIYDYVQFAMVVTDTSRSIKPYIYYEDAVQIAKLKPPMIIETLRTNNSIYVSWNNSQDIEKVEYEVLLTLTSSGREDYFKTSVSSIKLNALPDVTYSVKVRVKLKQDLLSEENSYTWSDWSKEEIFKGKDDERLTSIILPLILSAIVIIAAVFLLVHMEKLKALICPEIPDPARIFPNDLRQWLKNDINIVYSKPEKEEICPVYLLESLPATKCV
ncbi:interleukin-13 receptor subunit alpha-1-like [Mantella aurantiaca]